MYKLALPSARDLVLTHTFLSSDVLNSVLSTEKIIDCELTHLWFYVLDEKLDGVPNSGNRFFLNIEANMGVEKAEPGDARPFMFFSNYDAIRNTIFTVSSLMHNVVDRLLLNDPSLAMFTNAVSIVEYIDDSVLVIVFFNNHIERDLYVQTKRI